MAATQAELQQLRQEILQKLDELKPLSPTVPKSTEPIKAKGRPLAYTYLQPPRLVAPTKRFLCTLLAVNGTKYHLCRPSVVEITLSHPLTQTQYSMSRLTLCSEPF